ncbi:ABC transporter substrate-binding protein [Candidatus Uhrbacteria bacterium]|nr:ABC transporter substrate-binding protein [Candidatus Uhrbacteria bacterium]
MPEKNNNALLWAIGIVLIVLGFVYFSATGGSGGTIKVGVLTPLTGDEASYGTAMQRAYDLAVSQVKAAGGVNGKDIELVYEDSKCDGAAATTATEKLVNVDGVKFILGGTCSSETLAAAPITQAARVLLLSPSATSPDITEAGDLVFRTYPSDDFEAKMVAAYAQSASLTRAAIISETTDFAQGVRDAFKASYTGTLVFDETFTSGETDFSTLVTEMRASNPKMVYVNPQSPAAGERILKQISESGMNVAIFMNNAMTNRSAVATNPALYEEVVMAEVQLPSQGKAVDMLAAYEAKYGNAPEFLAFTASAYDSVYLLAEAVSSVGEDTQAVAGYFAYQVVDSPGALGTFNFDENGDAEVELTLVQAIGGALVPLQAQADAVPEVETTK